MTKIIELKGLQFKNKGSELMLYAILDKIRASFDDVKFTMAPNLGNRPYEKLICNDIYPKAWLRKCRIQWGYLANFFPNKIIKKYGLIKDSEIDVVIDGSGFAYGDQWGPKNTLKMAHYAKRWKEQGTKVILMPQAMGPFKKGKIKKAFRSIAKNANMICARDKKSYKYIVGLVGEEKDNIKVYPDFTVGLKGNIPKYFYEKKLNVAIIPNMRMIDKTSTNFTKEKYCNFLTHFINSLHKINKHPFFIIHAGKDDEQLAKSVQKNIKKQIPIIVENNPLNIKGIIGTCDFVFSSRYHGLINALSQGIPAIGTSWSHKYKELFNYYKHSDLLVDINIKKNEVSNLVKMISVNIDKIKKEILSASKAHMKEVDNMWEEVFEIINS